MSAPTVSFNGSDLASTVTGLRILATDPYRIPTRQVNFDPIASANNATVASAYWQSKKINVEVEIGRTTRELFEASLDQLMTILQGREKVLLFSYGSANRQWTATLANVKIDKVSGGFGEIDLEFQCSDPQGYDTSNTTLVTSARSGRTSTDNFVVAGTALTQVPVITITLTSVTGGSDKNVIIGNPATGQSVTVSRTWASNDVLVIDSQNKTVKVNGNNVEFSGAIPEWAPGSGSMSYEDTLTSGIHTHSVVYAKRYI